MKIAVHKTQSMYNRQYSVYSRDFQFQGQKFANEC